MTKTKLGNSSISAKLFMLAGFLMAMNTALLWIRRVSDYELSLLWPALAAISAFSLSIVGLLTFYPKVVSFKPTMAKTGAGFALLSCTSLLIALLWLFIAFVFGEGMPPVPPLFLVLIAVFMVTMVIAFICYAVACTSQIELLNYGYLLFVPVAMWLIMLIVGIFAGMEVGLGLDYFTNGFIAASFIGLGVLIKEK